MHEVLLSSVLRNDTVTSKNSSISGRSKDHTHYSRRQLCEKYFKIRHKDNYLQLAAECEVKVSNLW